MSSVSMTSSRREKANTELAQEIDAVRAINNSLRAYLEYLRGLNKNLRGVYENYTQMEKVNKQWVDMLSMKK